MCRNSRSVNEIEYAINNDSEAEEDFLQSTIDCCEDAIQFVDCITQEGCERGSNVLLEEANISRLSYLSFVR